MISKIEFQSPTEKTTVLRANPGLWTLKPNTFTLFLLTHHMNLLHKLPQYGINFQHSNEICFLHMITCPPIHSILDAFFCRIRYLAHLFVESSFSFVSPVRHSGCPCPPSTFLSHSSALMSIPIVL